MKKLLAVLLVLAICAANTFAQEAEESSTPMLDKMAKGTGRGLVNIVTGWMELPRNMWVETSRNPYYGVLTGISDGTWLGVIRTFGGTADFLTLGLTGPGFHGENFPDYVWDSPWQAIDPMINQ